MNSTFLIESLENRRMFDAVDIDGGGIARDSNWDSYDLVVSTATATGGTTSSGFTSLNLDMSGSISNGTYFYATWDVTLTLQNTSYQAHFAGNAEGDYTGVWNGHWDFDFVRDNQHEYWTAEYNGSGWQDLSPVNSAAENTTGATPQARIVETTSVPLIQLKF